MDMLSSPERRELEKEAARRALAEHRARRALAKNMPSQGPSSQRPSLPNRDPQLEDEENSDGSIDDRDFQTTHQGDDVEPDLPLPDHDEEDVDLGPEALIRTDRPVEIDPRNSARSSETPHEVAGHSEMDTESETENNGKVLLLPVLLQLFTMGFSCKVKVSPQS
jgi:hypothetical protein